MESRRKNFVKLQLQAAKDMEGSFVKLSDALRRYHKLGIEAARQVGGGTRAHRDARARLNYLIQRLPKAVQPALKGLSSCSQTLPELCTQANAKLIRLGAAKEQSAMARRRPAAKPKLSLEERITELEDR